MTFLLTAHLESGAELNTKREELLSAGSGNTMARNHSRVFGKVVQWYIYITLGLKFPVFQ